LITSHCSQFFNYARDARGQRKRLIELRPVVDTDGARDEVWHFVRGRAYELGALYFQCNANATATDPAQRAWDGVPLMGLPEAGRGAHWETRIMRDDVMSYGFRDFVSSITLAAMEDLGFYLANYSSADCMVHALAALAIAKLAVLWPIALLVYVPGSCLQH